MICNRCTALLSCPEFSNDSAFSTFTTAYGRNYQLLHPNIASLQHSFDRGCGFCHRLVRALAAEGTQIFPLKDQAASSLMVLCHFAFETESKRVISCLTEFRGRLNGKPLRERCTVCLFLAPGKTSVRPSSYYRSDHDEEQFPLEIDARMESSNGLWTKSLYIISAWLDKCEQKHTKCSQKRTVETQRRFARILDVTGLMQDPTVKLVLSTQLSPDVRYMTLSHCWGGATDIPTLTTSNYQTIFRQINIADLPRTFRDAIKLTRALGINYLWIDSLCIVQDSTEDWSREAIVMGETYQGSYLNIAASRSNNSHGGLFTHRDPSGMTPLRIDFGDRIHARMEPADYWVESDHSRQLVLEGSILRLVGTEETTSSTNQIKFDLNDHLGNEDGHFDPKGKNFARSAHNTYLVDGVLYSNLAKRNGEWFEDSFDLRSLIAIRSFTSSLIEMRLFGASGLTLTYRVSDQIDLNTCVGNHNGGFDPAGRNFAHSARNLSLNGSLLAAELRAINGEWRYDTVDLSPYIRSLEQERRASENLRRFYDVNTNDLDEWENQVKETRLCSRGWVLQERLLSPRALYFGARQIYYECVEMQSFEDRPHVETNFNIPARASFRALCTRMNMNFKLLDPFSADIVLQPDTRELDEQYTYLSARMLLPEKYTQLLEQYGLTKDQLLYEKLKQLCYSSMGWLPSHCLLRYWAKVVDCYVPTRLTFGTDRLVAIAGIAKLLSRRTGIRYVAGLWEYQLPRQLLWTYIPFTKERQLTDQTAPTWSWASDPEANSVAWMSLDPITETNGAMDLIRVLSVDIQGETESDVVFGRVSSGRLRIRGRLLPISLATRYWPEPQLREKDLMVPFYMGSVAKVPTQPTFLLPVIFMRWSDALPRGTPNSLLLEWTGQKGVYRRIGTARLNQACPLTDVVDDLITARETESPQVTDSSDLCDDELRLLTETSYQPKDGPISPQMELWVARVERTSLRDMEREIKIHVKQIFNHPMYAPLVAYGMRKVRRQFKQAEAMFPGRITQAAERGTPEAKTSTTRRFSTMIQTELRKRRKLKTTPPLQAVKPKFYHEYLPAEDQSSTQFGHFIFDII